MNLTREICNILLFKDMKIGQRKKNSNKWFIQTLFYRSKKPTVWLNGLVIIEKPNEKIHICLNPRPLNKVIKRECPHLLTTEGIFLLLSGACFSSKLLAFVGCREIKVDGKSSHNLAFITLLGRYFLTLFKMSLFGTAHRCGGATISKLCHTYPTLMKIGTVIPYLNMQISSGQSLISVDISIFSGEISKFCYIKKPDIDCILIHHF